MYFIAYKSLFRRKLRTALASVGVGIGVLLLVVILSTMLGMATMVDDITATMVGDIEVLEKGQFDLISEIDKDNEDAIEGVQGVFATYPRVIGFVKIEGVEDLPIFGGMINDEMLAQMPEEFADQMSGVRVVGIDPVKEADLGTYPTKLLKGSMLSKGDTGICLIGPILESEAGLAVGDRITLIFDKDDDGIGEKDKHRFKIVGVYDETGSELKNDNVIVNMEDAREIKGMSSQDVSVIYFRADPHSEDEVIRRVRALVPNVDVGGSREALKMMTRMTDNISLMTMLLIVFCGAIAFVFILIVMITSVMERTKEIGVLRATGWYKFDVLKLILVESMLLAIMGTVVGTILGILALVGMSQIFPGVEVIITPLLVMAVTIFGLTVGSVAGLYPAWRAASLSPLEAFRGAE